MSIQICGPEQYQMTIDPQGWGVVCKQGTTKFSGIATRKIPKLYIVSIDSNPITKSSISTRLRTGWRANGEHGYYGYRWRHEVKSARLNIWGHENAPDGKQACLDMETIEAEVVYLIRSRGQWPAYQTEIDFHPSHEKHREIAQDILAGIQ